MRVRVGVCMCVHIYIYICIYMYIYTFNAVLLERELQPIKEKAAKNRAEGRTVHNPSIYMYITYCTKGDARRLFRVVYIYIYKCIYTYIYIYIYIYMCVCVCV